MEEEVAPQRDRTEGLRGGCGTRSSQACALGLQGPWGQRSAWGVMFQPLAGPLITKPGFLPPLVPQGASTHLRARPGT